METSALTGECVDEVFVKCSSSIMSKIDGGIIDPESLLKGNQKNSDDDDYKEQRSCAC